MDNKGDKSKKTLITNKGARTYINYATKVALHPVRATILKVLHESEKSTSEMESLTNESRYNLYYHLNELERAGLIDWKMKDSKTKIYRLKSQDHPKVITIMLNNDEIKSNQKEFDALIDTLSQMEGRQIPSRKDIMKAEIFIYYVSNEEEKMDYNGGN
jgi:DNA-binding transcriptional ArsR family regulator